MSTVADASISGATRRLFVAWQDQETRAIEPVARLTRVRTDDAQVRYVFSYLRRALKLVNFEPFASFPDLHANYFSHDLFPFFANRVLARRRPDFEATMSMLDLTVEAEPFEILARSGGRRETDPLEVFPEPTIDDEGQLTCLFFARGLRYFDKAEDVVAELSEHDELRLLGDLQNPVNTDALILARLVTSDLRPVGYVPDYLVDHTHEMITSCGSRAVRVSVAHINARDTPRHMRLMCRIASACPAGYRPFSADGYQPISDLGL